MRKEAHKDFQKTFFLMTVSTPLFMSRTAKKEKKDSVERVADKRGEKDGYERVHREQEQHKTMIS